MSKQGTYLDTLDISGVAVTIGKVIVTLLILGMVGYGGFMLFAMLMCGGPSGVALIMILILVMAVLFGVYRTIKSIWSNKGKGEGVAITPTTNKYQKAVVDYIVQARAANLTDQTIHANLFAAGWTPDDISSGFEAVGGKK